MLSFATRAVGGTRAGDRTEIRRALALLIAPGDRHELRALPGGQGRIALGDDLDAAVQAAMDLSDQMVYWSLNPIQPGENRASKKTVVKRMWFLIDVDPVRPRDVSSTDEESGRAYAVAATIAGDLLDHGWPAPVIVDSGNGWHLLYRIDLPNDKLTQELLKAALAALAEEHNSPWAVVDRATHDAPRISKLPGTWARKGPDAPDRPHRPCRIVFEPDAIEVVTVDQIRALGSPSPAQSANGPPQALSFATVASDGPGKTAYVRSAIERECYRVMIAPNGTRNDSLNRAAFALGQFESWPEMAPHAAIAALKQAASRCGLADDETKLTIESGWKAGAQQPRPRPLDPAAGGPASGQAPKPMPAKLTVGLHEIVPKKIDWIWENVVAIGFISIFAGRTGVGKSFVTCDLVARLSRGDVPPFAATKRAPCRTLFISEDPPEYMLGPRLLAMNAVQDRVRFMTWEAMSSYQLGRIDIIEAAYQECGQPTLIVIDPPTNFLGKIDDHKNSELRGVLMGLVEWINRHGVAMIMITHLNKAGGKGLDAVSRVIGGTAWTTVGRVTIVFESDPDNPAQCLMGSGKINIGRKADTLAYTIESTTAGDTAVVKWIGPVDTTADDAVNKIKKKSRALSAIEWLEDRFRERREWPSDELRTEALQYGLSKNALWEPEVQALPIGKRQQTTVDGKRCWVWFAQYGWPPEKANGNLGNVGICEPKSNDANAYHRFPMGEECRESDSAVTFPGMCREGQIPDARESVEGDGSEGVAASDSQIPGRERGESRDMINKMFKPF